MKNLYRQIEKKFCFYFKNKTFIAKIKEPKLFIDNYGKNLEKNRIKL